MKKLYNLLIYILLISLNHVYSQNAPINDEVVRKKLLVNYIDQVHFEYSSAEADAMSKIIISTFTLNLSLPIIDYSNINLEDKVKLDALYYSLMEILKNNPPSWEYLIELEKIRLIKEDKAMRRVTKYSN